MSEKSELKESIVEAVAARDAPGFDELAEDLDVSADELDEALEELQADRELRFSGRSGGWQLDTAASN